MEMGELHAYTPPWRPDSTTEHALGQIFIVEGILTVALGVVTFFCLADSPALSSSWLDPDEIRFLELRQHDRIEYGVGGAGKKRMVNWDVLLEVVKDWKIYLLVLVNWSCAVPGYALKFTMPQIVKNMGYTSGMAQLLTIPPYVGAAIAAFIFAVYADRYSWRMPFIFGPQLLLVASFVILFMKGVDIAHNIGLCYFAVCLAALG